MKIKTEIETQRGGKVKLEYDPGDNSVAVQTPGQFAASRPRVDLDAFVAELQKMKSALS